MTTLCVDHTLVCTLQSVRFYPPCPDAATLNYRVVQHLQCMVQEVKSEYTENGDVVLPFRSSINESYHLC